MKMSTLAALLNGDLENAIVSATPGGIEAQEKQGQVTFVGNSTLPKECNFCTRQQLEEMGIVFGEDADDLFVNVTLPDGWKKVPTDHSMWSKLVDEKGRERAGIFYKAAFYDRKAHIGLSRRFSCGVVPVNGYDSPTYHEDNRQSQVTDCGQIIWRSEKTIAPMPSGRENYEAYLAWREEENALEREAVEWLEQHYPDWKNPLAYWD